MTVIQAVSVFLLVGFLTYVASILVPYLRYKPKAPGNPERFEWHFFIPCRDEEAVIRNTIDRLSSTFPGTHMWIIDDDSEDQTATIVMESAEKNPFVHLVQRRRPNARTGKGDALNSAYHALDDFLPPGADRSSVIVCVLDADGELAANALEQAAGEEIFANSKVGAAQTTVRMKNRDEREPFGTGKPFKNFGARYLIRMQDIEFRTMIAAMQSLRENTSSVGLGGNGQFTRLIVLDLIAREAGEPWHGALLEDYELGVHVLLAGYENRHIHETLVDQEALGSLRRFLTQRTRWSQGNIQCVKYIRQIVSSRKFSNAAVVESCYYLVLPFLQVLGFLVWIALGVMTLSAAVTNAEIILSLRNEWWILLLLFTFSVAPFAVWGPIYKVKCEPQASWLQAAGWSIGIWLYIFYTYVSVTRGFFRVVTGRSGWLKTRRNGEVNVTGPTAKDA